MQGFAGLDGKLVPRTYKRVHAAICASFICASTRPLLNKLTQNPNHIQSFFRERPGHDTLREGELAHLLAPVNTQYSRDAFFPQTLHTKPTE